MSPKSRPISSRPLAIPHLGKYTCESMANRSRMLPPVEVVPPLSNALRYSSATDLRCSSVMDSLVTAIAGSLSDGCGVGSGRLPVGGPGRAVGERDDRAEGGAAGPVRLRGRRRDAVADAVQAGDRVAGVVEDLAVGVGARAALGVEGAAGDQCRVVRAGRADRPHRRVGAPRFVADEAVEQQLHGRLAAMEVLVDAGSGEAVEPL